MDNKSTRKAKITKRVVDAAQPEEDTYFIWDTVLPGYGLQVLPTGTKTFVFSYRNAHGSKRRAAIAKVGALTPEQARDIAEDWSAALKKGRDPLEDRKAAREALTVGELLDLYMKSGRFLGEKAESTRKTDKGRIEGHLRPLLGSKIAATLTPDEVRTAFKKIRDGKTAKKPVKVGRRAVSHVRGGEGAARKSIRLLAAVYSWGMEDPKNGLTENPAKKSAVDVGTDGEREIFLEPEDYTRLFETLATMEAEGRLRSTVADLFRLYAITGARRSDLLKLVWREVDLKAGNITLPPTRHKTGRKTGKPKIITLETVAQEIIARQPEGDADAFVFVPAKGEGHLVPEKDWRAVRVEAKLPNYVDGTPCGFHGLRHSIGSHLAMDGAEGPQIKQVLGHSSVRMSERYIHFAKRAKSELAVRAAAPALAGMAAAASAPKAAVTLLNGKGRTR